MKFAHPLVIEIEKRQIVELLQDHVARVEQDVRARMIIHRSKKALEGRAVVQVLAWMEFKAGVNAGLVERVQNGHPAPREFREGLIDQTLRPLRPRIKIWPGQ